ncbi:ATP-binding protein [Candidatus Saccharibacteria bacterium]|nr:ATP-binding protein [Candidatus Saccharibacteria bacterium]
METKEYKPRVTDKKLEFLLKAKGAVVIDGPKWCGKTTSAKQFAKSSMEFGDGANQEQNIAFAKLNPSATLSGETPRLFDEWQEVPMLWDAVRYEVDRRNMTGQFILTGSSVKIPKGGKDDPRHHTGTGRFSYLKMRPMSLYESGESNGQVSLTSLFDAPSSISATSDIDLNKLAFVTCRGGWPFATTLEDDYALYQVKDYYNSLIKDDISRVDNVSRDERIASKVLRSYARNQAQSPSIEDISEDVGEVTPETVSTYLNALRKLYVIEDAPAWNPNLRSKTAIRTSDTRYFVDPSIATAALGLNPDGLIGDLRYFGFLFETLAFRDLRIYLSPSDGKVYHYRDKNGLECDAVTVLPDGKYGLIQIKLGFDDETINQAVEKLNALRDKIDPEKMKLPSFMMVITGVGQYAYRREDGIYVVPIGCLKP